MYIKNNTREGLEGFEASSSERFGSVHGISYSAMLGFWIFGPRDVNGVPASRGGAADPNNVDGRIRVNAFSVGLNYWATKHVRLTLNYVCDQFPDSAPVKATAAGGPSQTSSNRAAAPGNTIASGLDDRGRDHAHDLQRAPGPHRHRAVRGRWAARSPGAFAADLSGHASFVDDVSVTLKKA